MDDKTKEKPKPRPLPKPIGFGAPKNRARPIELPPPRPYQNNFYFTIPPSRDLNEQRPQGIEYDIFEDQNVLLEAIAVLKTGSNGARQAQINPVLNMARYSLGNSGVPWNADSSIAQHHTQGPDTRNAQNNFGFTNEVLPQVVRDILDQIYDIYDDNESQQLLNIVEQYVGKAATRDYLARKHVPFQQLNPFNRSPQAPQGYREFQNAMGINSPDRSKMMEYLHKCAIVTEYYNRLSPADKQKFALLDSGYNSPANSPVGILSGPMSAVGYERANRSGYDSTVNPGQGHLAPNGYGPIARPGTGALNNTGYEAMAKSGQAIFSNSGQIHMPNYGQGFPGYGDLNKMGHPLNANSGYGLVDLPGYQPMDGSMASPGYERTDPFGQPKLGQQGYLPTSNPSPGHPPIVSGPIMSTGYDPMASQMSKAMYTAMLAAQLQMLSSGYKPGFLQNSSNSQGPMFPGQTMSPGFEPVWPPRYDAMPTSLCNPVNGGQMPLPGYELNPSPMASSGYEQMNYQPWATGLGPMTPPGHQPPHTG